MYLALARTIWTDVDRDAVADSVQRLRARQPSLSDGALADRLIRRTALRCAAVAAVASAPPGILAMVPLAADLSYQVLALNRLVLSIAYVYGRRTTREQRAASVAASLALGGGAELARKQLVHAARRFIRRRAASRFLPVVGATLGGALTYVSVIMVGREAKEYYRRRGVLPRRRAAARG